MENIFSNYDIRITTEIDGQNQTVQKKGQAKTNLSGFVFFYIDEVSKTEIDISSKSAEIVRTGDYSMALLLEEGKKTSGSMSISGNDGTIDLTTQKIIYKIKDNTFTVLLRYTLHFGKEAQNTSVRIYGVRG